MFELRSQVARQLINEAMRRWGDEFVLDLLADLFEEPYP